MCAKTRILPIAVLTGVALVSCRSPELPGEWSPDGGDFDGGVDDAGPGELCPSDAPDLFNNAYSPYVGGEVEIDLEVVHFSYFRCPHCADFAQYTRELWETRPEYRNRVRLYFHHFPFTSETAWKLHAATVAAHNQGLEHFWAMHDYIYDAAAADDPVQRSPEDLRAFAEDVLGLDMVQYDLDVEEGSAVWGFLEWDKAQGQAAGVTGTPKVFVCGELLSGWSKLDDTVDAYLEID
jgi:protein-disulfide isomerase